MIRLAVTDALSGRYGAAIVRCLVLGVGALLTAPLALEAAEATPVVPVDAAPAPDPDDPTLGDRIAAWKEAQRLRDEKKLPEAIAAGERLAALVRRTVGVDHVDYLITLEFLADAYAQANLWSQSESTWAELVSRRVQRQGADHWQTINARLALDYARLVPTLSEDQRSRLREADVARQDARSSYRIAQVSRGLRRAEEALTVYRDILGTNHPLYAAGLSDVADLLRANVELARAEALYRDVIEIRLALYGKRHPGYAQSLNKLAETYRAMGDFAQAEPLFREALEIRREVFGNRHYEYAESLNNLALLHGARGEFQQAQTALLEAVEILRTAIGERDARFATVLCNLADVYRVTGNHAQAEALYVQARDIRKAVLGGQHPEYAGALQSLSLIARDRGEFARALELLREAAAILKSELGERHPSYAACLHHLGEVQLVMGAYTEAETHFQQALEIRRTALGEKHLQTAHTLNNLAILYRRRGDLDQAEKLYLEVLAIRRLALGERHPDYGQSLNNLGVFYAARGEYAKAEAMLREAREVMIAVVGAQHPDFATSQINLADVYVRKGEFSRAEPLYQEALEIFRATVGPRSQPYMQTLLSLAHLTQWTGDFRRAEPLYRQVLEAARAGLGVRHPFYAEALSALSDLYRQNDRDDLAEPLQRQALAIRQEVWGGNHPDVAASLTSLALILIKRREFAEAESLLLRSRAVNEAMLGAQHPAVAVSLMNLAELRLRQGKFAEAEPLYRQALEIRQSALGTTHPAYAQSLYSLALLSAAQGQVDRAGQLLHEAIDVAAMHVEATALAQDELAQLATERQVRGLVDAYVSNSFRQEAGGDEAYNVVLRWKGATLVRQRAARLAADSAELAPLFEDLQSVVRQWSALVAAPSSDGAGCKERIDALASRKQRLEADLSRQSAAIRSAATVPQVADLKSVLPDRAALVDYLEYWDLDFAAERPGEPIWRRSLAAFVIRPGREVQMFALGEVAPIYAAIDQWRISYGTTPESRQAGAALREALWAPLAAEVGGASIVLISPDGALGKLPFAALPGAAPDSYLIEDVCLALAPVPRLIPALVDDDAPRAELPRDLLVLGGVDYDRRTAGNDGPARRRPWERRDDLVAQRSIVGGGRWEFLQGTDSEAAFVVELYSRLLDVPPGGDRVVRLRGPQATEEAFRRLAPEAYLLHVATHGFFAAADKASALSAAGGAPAAGGVALTDARLAMVRGYSPGLLSGLVLAGANVPIEVPDDPDHLASAPEDGILTAEEIAFLPLAGARLVVLSACESGLGESAGGEGLLGIQRGFQVAGAHATIATLWKVNDEATRRIMEEFYRNYLEGEMSPLDALRAAQLWALRNPDLIPRGADEPVDAAAHARRLSPRYWAAFTLSGDWR